LSCTITVTINNHFRFSLILLLATVWIFVCPAKAYEGPLKNTIDGTLKAYGGKDQVHKIKTVSAHGLIDDFLRKSSGGYQSGVSQIFNNSYPTASGAGGALVQSSHPDQCLLGVTFPGSLFLLFPGPYFTPALFWGTPDTFLLRP
jgi:hypothetical protein